MRTRCVRLLQIACGYEDCNDATKLPHGTGVCDGDGRVAGHEKSALASQPTLSRFEQRDGGEVLRMSEILADLWIDQILARGPKACKNIVLEFDSTDQGTPPNSYSEVVARRVVDTNIPFFTSADNFSVDACGFAPNDQAYTASRPNGTVFVVAGTALGAGSDNPELDYRWQIFDSNGSGGFIQRIGLDSGSNVRRLR